MSLLSKVTSLNFAENVLHQKYKLHPYYETENSSSQIFARCVTIEYFWVNIFSTGFTTVQLKHNGRSNDNMDVQEKPITLRFAFLLGPHSMAFVLGRTQPKLSF